MLHPGWSLPRAAHPRAGVGRAYLAFIGRKKGRTEEKKMTREGRRQRFRGAMKPPMPRLAMVEAAEQSLKLRVWGCGRKGLSVGGGELGGRRRRRPEADRRRRRFEEAGGKAPRERRRPRGGGDRWFGRCRWRGRWRKTATDGTDGSASVGGGERRAGLLYTACWRRGRKGPRTPPVGVSSWAAAHEVYYFCFFFFFFFSNLNKFEI
jgi:hypothetical protein